MSVCVGGPFYNKLPTLRLTKPLLHILVQLRQSVVFDYRRAVSTILQSEVKYVWHIYKCKGKGHPITGHEGPEGE